MTQPTILFKILPRRAALPLPFYASAGASGLDLQAAEDATIEPGKAAVISTGLLVQLPEGYEGQVRSRSGLAAKHRVAVLNSPGTVDQDYRGELKVILANFGDAPFQVRFGERIAQLVVVKVEQVRVVAAYELSATERDEDGFGSTGA